MRRRNLKKKKGPRPPFYLDKRFGTNHVVCGGKREKGAEHSMTKGNSLISNLIKSYGKQENDDD